MKTNRSKPAQDRRVHPLPTAAQASGESALLDVKDVSGLLRCSSRHVYRLADAGKMPRPVKLGALVRWSRRTIEQWIQEGCPAVGRVPGDGS
jgi:excisionase family DNA binding protein